MTVFKLPDLGEGLPDAEIHEWHVQVGDTVTVDQPLVSMETAKAVVEVPAPHAGQIKKLYGEPGDLIVTGSPLIEFEAQEAPTAGASASSTTVAGQIEEGAETVEETATIITRKRSKSQQGVLATPAVRALAQRLDVDLSQLKGSGSNGLITLDDVRQAKTSSPTSSAAQLTSAEPLKGTRRTMAQIMKQAHEEVAPASIFDQATISHWEEDEDISFRLARAVFAACTAEPALNVWFDGAKQQWQAHTQVNLGLAMDSTDGLFVPVLSDLAQLTQTRHQFRAALNRLKDLVQTRKVPTEELQGATLTLSNFGVFAGRHATPVVVPPQVAIVAAGRIHEQVLPIKGIATIARVLPLSLTFDHRAVTGGEASRFLLALLTDLQR